MRKIFTQIAVLFMAVAVLVAMAYFLVGFQMAVLVAVVASGCGATIIITSALEPQTPDFPDIRVAKLVANPDDLADDGFMPEDAIRDLMQKIVAGEMPSMGVITVNGDGSFDIKEPEEPKLSEEEAKALSEKWE